MTQLKVTPEDNDTSKSLKAGGDKNVAALKALKGAAFDKAYVDHEVAYHQQVLDAVDKTLIPSAQNAELKALLVKVRPAFVAHLEHAQPSPVVAREHEVRRDDSEKRCCPARAFGTHSGGPHALWRAGPGCRCQSAEGGDSHDHN